MNSLKEKIHHLVEKGSYGSRVNLLFDYFIIILIILNVIALAVETVRGLPEQLIASLRIFEFVLVIIFSVEYAMRIYISDITHPSKNRISSALKFIFSPYGLIDLLAILPFFITLLVKVDLRYLRILRLMRVLRILKISRYSSSLKLIRDVLMEKSSEIGMTFLIAFILLIISGFVMFSIENKVQPDVFPDVFASLWWAVITLTTVGYGDIYPVTALGKVINGFVAVLGIGLITLPAGIISAGFIEKISRTKKEHKKEICPHCGKEIVHDDGRSSE
jgi:voltage-gated potassium channel